MYSQMCLNGDDDLRDRLRSCWLCKQVFVTPDEDPWATLCQGCDLDVGVCPMCERVGAFPAGSELCEECDESCNSF